MFPNPFKKLKTPSFWLVVATAVILLGVVLVGQNDAQAQLVTQVIIGKITYNVTHPPNLDSRRYRKPGDANG